VGSKEVRRKKDFDPMIVRGDVHFSVDVRFPDEPQIEIVGTASGLRSLARQIEALAEDMTSGQPGKDIGEHFHWFGTLAGEENDSLKANFRKIDRPSTGLPDPKDLERLYSANTSLMKLLNQK
jgi:hypothetical protein